MGKFIKIDKISKVKLIVVIALVVSIILLYSETMYRGTWTYAEGPNSGSTVVMGGLLGNKGEYRFVHNNTLREFKFTRKILDIDNSRNILDFEDINIDCSFVEMEKGNFILNISQYEENGEILIYPSNPGTIYNRKKD